MEQHVPGAKPAPSTALGRVAILVDGENIPPSLAGQIITKSLTCGPLVIRRVYGNAAMMPTWDAAPGFRLIHSGSGKNATDLLLAIDAMALAYSGQADTLIIASSDRDFTHLANHLREKGHRVVGMGEVKATVGFRKACSQFIEIGSTDKGTSAKAPDKPTAPSPKPSLVENQSKQRSIPTNDTDTLLCEIIRSEGTNGLFPIANINAAMRKRTDIKIATTADRTWRAYLINRPHIYICDPKGPKATVRLTAP